MRMIKSTDRGAIPIATLFEPFRIAESRHEARAFGLRYADIKLGLGQLAILTSHRAIMPAVVIPLLIVQLAVVIVVRMNSSSLGF